jgi:hypothetical protein
VCLIFRNKFNFYGEGLLAPHPNPKLEDHPLSFVQGCLFDIFAANLHSWRPFLRPQPEDAPCCGDRDPLNISFIFKISKFDCELVLTHLVILSGRIWSVLGHFRIPPVLFVLHVMPHKCPINPDGNFM